MSRRTLTNTVWLILAGLLIATGLNVALHEGWVVSAVIAAICIGGLCAPLLTFGTAAKVLTRSEPRAVAELQANIRKELPE
jgi:hypothetical protein